MIDFYPSERDRNLSHIGYYRGVDGFCNDDRWKAKTKVSVIKMNLDMSHIPCFRSIPQCLLYPLDCLSEGLQRVIQVGLRHLPHCVEHRAVHPLHDRHRTTAQLRLGGLTAADPLDFRFDVLDGANGQA